jgi:putative endopeptidase
MFKPIARLLAATAVISFAVPALAQTAAPTAPATDLSVVPGDWGNFGLQTQNVDPTVRPGDDFNRYVNGKWMATAEIPADRTRFGSFDTLAVLSEARTKAILDELVASNPAPGSDAARIAAAYRSYMDVDAIERAGLTPLKPYLDRINAAKTPADLLTLFAQPGIASPLGIGVGIDGKDSSQYVVQVRAGGLGLPDRDYYLVDTPRNREIQAKYKEYLTFLFGQLGYADPAKATADVYALETKLAADNWDRALGRNRDLTYNKLSIDEFAALAPEVPLKTLLAAYGTPDAPYVIVSQLPPTAAELAAAKYTPAMAAKLGGGVPAVAKLIASEPIGVWQAWLAKNLLAGNASVLPKRIDDASFAFGGKFLNGQPQQRERWKRAIGFVEGSAGELLGKIYAERYFPAANKAAMQGLVANLRAAMAANLKDLKWMSPATRLQAEAKLATFDPKIGYTDKWKTYDGLTFTPSSAFENAMAAARWGQADNLSRLGQPVDRTEWGMLPQTVNAYYNPTKNEIVFPAAILQAPFFQASADPAINYGAIGAVIGHEMGHGFDDQGSKSDGAGNLRDWWTAEDKAAFTRLTDALVAQYDANCPFDETTSGGKACVNGRLTLGENIGDLGGLSLAYRAYKMSLNGKKAPVIGGLTGDQRFFMAYAQVWREKIRDEALRQRLKTDSHSPAQFRINAIVRNFDEWYKAFNVRPGHKLYLPPAQRLRIW